MRLHPFRAVRPRPDLAERVAAVPYDVVNREEAAALARGNPYSFLHVGRSDIDLPPETDPHDPRIYAGAREALDRFQSEGILVREEIPALYLYRQIMDGRAQTGVVGCVHIDDYEHDVIRKHEKTRQDKEDDRTRHIVELRAQTGIVFLTYKAAAAIDDVARRVAGTEPIYDFTAADGVQHTLWRTGGEETRALVAAFAGVPALYIADGHHRAASAARARAELRTRAGAGDADTFIAVAFPDDQVQILPYNRTVKDLAGQTPDAFLQRLRAEVTVAEASPTPERKGDVRMYLAGKWYALDLRGLAPEDDSRAASLDVALLQKRILEPLLAVGDLRTDKRIDFVGGARGTAALEQAVNSGKAAVAFSMYPVSVEDLMVISDSGGIMPPKSTWFEPKLRDGLLVHTI